MANTTRTQIPAEVTDIYDRTLLDRVTPLLPHGQWAQIRDIPRNAGTKQINFRRYSNLAAATTPLAEGVTPAGKQLSVTKVYAIVAQYGDFVTVTDILTYESADPILMETAEILGDQAALTLDTLTRDIMVAGSNVRYANAVVGRTSLTAGVDLPDEADFDAAILTLKNGLAMKMTKMVNPDTGYNTHPVRPCYIGICHVNTTPILEKMNRFIPVEKYANKADVMEGEVGTYRDIRFIETTNAKVFTGGGAGGADVYATMILGMHAYGKTRVSGEALKNIVKPLGSGGTEDPLDQRATSGWKATYVAKILNDSFITRVEHVIY